MKKLPQFAQSPEYGRTIELLEDLAYPPPNPEVRRIYASITRKIRAYKFPALKASFDRQKKVYQLSIEKMQDSFQGTSIRYPIKFIILQFEVMKTNPIVINASFGQLPDQKVEYVIAPEKLDTWVNDIMAQVFTICL